MSRRGASAHNNIENLKRGNLRILQVLTLRLRRGDCDTSPTKQGPRGLPSMISQRYGLQAHWAETRWKQVPLSTLRGNLVGCLSV